MPHRFLTFRRLMVALIILALLGLFAKALVQRFSFFKPPQGPTMVEAITVATQNITESVSAVGTLASDESVIIRPEVEGRIKSINFVEGQEVKAGDVLILIDDSTYRADRNERAATYKLSQINYTRAVGLTKKGAGSAQSRDEALAKLQTSEAALQSAEILLSKTKITAPFDGIVGLHDLSVGDFLKVGQEITHIEANDLMRVAFTVPEKYAGRLKTNQALTLKVDAFPNEIFDGTIYAIDPKIDSSTRNLSAKADVVNMDRKLKPGMFAYVSLVLSSRETIMIPESAIIPEASRVTVLKIDQGKAVAATVKTGLRKDNQVEITEGLKVGDVVITAGQMKTRPGAEVKIAEPPQSSKP